MAETLESFVEKLQAEGVQAGQAQAERIMAEAREQAQQIVAQAQEEAKQMRVQAQQDVEGMVEKGRTELRLASRDVVYALRAALTRILRGVLARPVEKQLQDKELLARILHEIVLQYAQADSQTRRELEIHVTEKCYHELAGWALGELHKAAQQGQQGGGPGVSIDLKGTLREAGFEYRIDGGTVEVTVDSVVTRLVEMLSPRLRELMDEAMAAEQGE